MTEVLKILPEAAGNHFQVLKTNQVQRTNQITDKNELRTNQIAGFLTESSCSGEEEVEENVYGGNV